MSRGGWRPALRIARRTVRRSLKRSLLVAVLVAVPVAGATLVDIIYRTTDRGGELDAYRYMGNSDAVVQVTRFETLSDGYYPSRYNNGTYVPEGGERDKGTADERDPTTVDAASTLPDGTRLIPRPWKNWNTWISHGDHTIRVTSSVATFNDPLTRHRVRLDAGRWPQADDEALVSRSLAKRLGILGNGGNVLSGSSVELRDGPEIKITGLSLDPMDLNGEQLVVAPGTAAAEQLEAQNSADGADLSSEPGYPDTVSYIADLPEGTDVDQLWPALAEKGVGLVPRQAVIDPSHYAPPGEHSYATSINLQAIGLVALVVGLGLFEVVLLAGAAFAVGARRQVHDLGLMAAGGATPKQIRRVVLAQGLTLGGLGAVLGVVAGALVAVLGQPLWEWQTNMLIETWRFGPWEILAAAAVGLFSGLAAAIVPAVGAARMRPIDALAERFRTTRLTARLPVAGIILVLVGAGGALLASRLAAGDVADYADRIVAAEGSGQYVAAPETGGYIALQLLGAALTIAGVVIIIPGLVAVLARAARHWPLSARLAVRDAARHRHRTAPTVAAITIVVAGSIGLAFAVQGQERADELRYTPALPDDVIEILPDSWPMDDADLSALFEEATAAATAQLPDADVYTGTQAVGAADEPVRELEPLWVQNPPCSTCELDEWVSAPLWLGDDDGIALAARAGVDERSVRRALDEGNVVVFDPALVDDGTVQVAQPGDSTGQCARSSETYCEGEAPTELRLPAHLEDRGAVYTSLPAALVPPGIVEEHGWQTTTWSVLVDPRGQVSDDDFDTAVNAVTATGATAHVEHGRDAGIFTAATLSLAAGAALVTLVGVGVAVALAAVEGRADLATLAAVGAQPQRRRLLAGGQALVVSGLGTVLGCGLGAYFAYLAWPAIGAPEFLVPWNNIALTGVAVPLLAVAIAMVSTPKRLPLVRRMT